MKRINPLSAAIGVSLLCAMAGTAMAGELRTADRPIEGRYIVVLKENAARLANERSSAARVSRARCCWRRRGALTWVVSGIGSGSLATMGKIYLHYDKFKSIIY